MKFALEEVLGLYSIFGLLGISSNLAVRLGARNISSMHTSTQVGLDTLGYEIPQLAVVAFEFVEFDLM